MASAYSRLHAMAKAEFPDLSPAEEVLVRAVVAGTTADCSEALGARGGAAIDAANPDLRLRVALIRWLCVDRNGASLVEAKGVHIRHAHIVGRLDLSYVNLRFPLTLTGCFIPEGIDFTQADLRALSLDGSVTGSIDGAQAVLRGSLAMRDGFAARGEVRLSGASVHGSLELSGGAFLNRGGDALLANGLSVAGSLFMDKKFRAEGGVRLVGATIAKMLVCSGARFINPGGEAISADGLRVGSSILFDRKFTALGEVRLIGAVINGDLSCRGARLLNPRNDALSADGLRVHGSVNLNRGFRAFGKVRLIGAEIKRDLTCRDAWLHNSSGDALVGDRINVRGSVFFDGTFGATGMIHLGASRVGGDLHLRYCEFRGSGPTGLHAENAHVEGKFFWKAINLAPGTVLDLSYASVGQLADDEQSWPSAGNIALNGFTYRTIVEGPTDARLRLQWLRRQPAKPFHTQPYDQLVEALRSSGHESEAVQIAIAREDARLKFGDLTLLSRLQQAFLKYFGDYGYKPHHRALTWASLLIVVGALVFHVGFAFDKFSPTRERVYLDDSYRINKRLPEDYPTFNALVYSIDALVPFLDMHQEDYWLPNANRQCEAVFGSWPCGAILRIYLWVHIAMGWVVTTLFAIGFSGAMKKE